MPALSRAHGAALLRLRSGVILALVLGCGSGVTGKPGSIQKEIVVRPHTSEVVSVTYYELRRFGEKQDWISFDPNTDWPPGGKVTQTVITTLPQSQASPRAGPLEPSLGAATDSQIVALFAGGEGPSGQVASRGAVLFTAADGPTGLQMVQARVNHTMSNLPGHATLIAGGYG